MADNKSLFSEFRAALRMPVRIGTWATVSLITGLAGPFGTYAAMELPLRLLFWAGIVAASVVIVVGARLIVVARFPNLNYVWVSGLVSLILATLLTPMIVLIAGPLAGLDYTGKMPTWWIGALVFLVALCVDLVRFLVVQSLRHEADTSKTSEAPPRLLARLPEAMVGEIMHLSGQDHHVEVRTCRGVCHIRLRLRDAISEMDGIDGLCTHRSHWVALAAVAGHDRVDFRPVLVLVDGTQVPISRKYAPDVEARGLI